MLVNDFVFFIDQLGYKKNVKCWCLPPIIRGIHTHKFQGFLNNKLSNEENKIMEVRVIFCTPFKSGFPGAYRPLQ